MLLGDMLIFLNFEGGINRTHRTIGYMELTTLICALCISEGIYVSSY